MIRLFWPKGLLGQSVRSFCNIQNSNEIMCLSCQPMKWRLFFVLILMLMKTRCIRKSVYGGCGTDKNSMDDSAFEWRFASWALNGLLPNWLCSLKRTRTMDEADITSASLWTKRTKIWNEENTLKKYKWKKKLSTRYYTMKRYMDLLTHNLGPALGT